MDMIVDFLGSMTSWHWFALGAALLILEIVTPTFYMLWLGIAAVVTGLVMLVAPSLHWTWAITIFGVMSVISTILWQAFFANHRSQDAVRDLSLNQRTGRYVGRRAVVAESFRNGRGPILLDDTRWQAVCEGGGELEPGSSVEITGADGAILRVRAV